MIGVKGTSSSPVVPEKDKPEGLGSKSTFGIKDKLWRTSLQYFSRLGHIPNQWIRKRLIQKHYRLHKTLS